MWLGLIAMYLGGFLGPLSDNEKLNNVCVVLILLGYVLFLVYAMLHSCKF